MKLRFEQQSSEYQRRLSEYDLKLVRLEQMRATSRRADEKDGSAASASDAEKRVQREPQRETKRREEPEREREDAARWQHEKLHDESIQRRQDELAAARKAEPRSASAAEPERKRKPELPTSVVEVEEVSRSLISSLEHT